MFGHPAIIASSLVLFANENISAHWSTRGRNSYDLVVIARICCNLTQGFAVLALITMTIDRYLAITRPIFHKTSVTKRRLLAILLVMLTLFAGFRVFRFFKSFMVTYYCIGFVSKALPLLFLAGMNYRMFAIAVKARRIRGTAKFRTQMSLLKKNSTCLLTVSCFIICITPLIVYAVLRATSTALLSEDVLLIIRVWGNTSMTLNSSLNCLIFFWKNEILRNKGRKLLAGCLKLKC